MDPAKVATAVCGTKHCVAHPLDKPISLPVEKGDVLLVLDDTHDWWQCENVDGKSGAVPSVYLTVLTDPKTHPEWTRRQRTGPPFNAENEIHRLSYRRALAVEEIKMVISFFRERQNKIREAHCTMRKLEARLEEVRDELAQHQREYNAYKHKISTANTKIVKVDQKLAALGVDQKLAALKVDQKLAALKVDQKLAALKADPPHHELEVLRRRVAELEDQSMCVVCMDHFRSTRLDPCGHVACCAACASIITKTTADCPICKAHIERIEPSFLT